MLHNHARNVVVASWVSISFEVWGDESYNMKVMSSDVISFQSFLARYTDMIMLVLVVVVSVHIIECSNQFLSSPRTAGHPHIIFDPPYSNISIGIPGTQLHFKFAIE